MFCFGEKIIHLKKNYTQNKIAGGIIYDSIHEIDLNNFLFKNVKFINSYNLNYNKKIFKILHTQI